MDRDKSVTATFAINTYTLTVTTVGSGTVELNPPGGSYDYGTSVTLSATAAIGWHFVGWSGDASGSEPSTTVLMDRDKSVTATFAINTHTLTVATVGSGTVELNPPGGSYDYGTSVTLTVTAATGWHFTGWSGEASGSDPTRPRY